MFAINRELHPPKCYVCFKDTEKPEIQIFAPDQYHRVCLCSEKCIKAYDTALCMINSLRLGHPMNKVRPKFTEIVFEDQLEEGSRAVLPQACRRDEE